MTRFVKYQPVSETPSREELWGRYSSGAPHACVILEPGKTIFDLTVYKAGSRELADLIKERTDAEGWALPESDCFQFVVDHSTAPSERPGHFTLNTMKHKHRASEARDIPFPWKPNDDQYARLADMPVTSMADAW